MVWGGSGVRVEEAITLGLQKFPFEILHLP